MWSSPYFSSFPTSPILWLTQWWECSLQILSPHTPAWKSLGDFSLLLEWKCLVLHDQTPLSSKASSHSPLLPACSLNCILLLLRQARTAPSAWGASSFPPSQPSMSAYSQRVQMPTQGSLPREELACLSSLATASPPGMSWYTFPSWHFMTVIISPLLECLLI